MLFGYKLSFSEPKSVNDFIHFKLIISSFIKVEQLMNVKILLNGVLICQLLDF